MLFIQDDIQVLFIQDDIQVLFIQDDIQVFIHNAILVLFIIAGASSK